MRSANTASASSSSQTGCYQRKPFSTVDNASDANLADISSDYNNEQEVKCRAILRAKDYYSILGLSKNCTAEEVKKAYRKVRIEETLHLLC